MLIDKTAITRFQGDYKIPLSAQDKLKTAILNHPALKELGKDLRKLPIETLVEYSPHTGGLTQPLFVKAEAEKILTGFKLTKKVAVYASADSSQPPRAILHFTQGSVRFKPEPQFDYTPFDAGSERWSMSHRPNYQYSPEEIWQLQFLAQCLNIPQP